MEGGHVEAVVRLLRHGSDPLLYDYSGNMPIDLARESEVPELLQFFSAILNDLHGKKAERWNVYHDREFALPRKESLDLPDNPSDEDFEPIFEVSSQPLPPEFILSHRPTERFVLHSDLKKFTSLDINKLSSKHDVIQLPREEFLKTAYSCLVGTSVDIVKTDPVTLVKVDPGVRKMLGIDEPKLFSQETKKKVRFNDTITIHEFCKDPLIPTLLNHGVPPSQRSMSLKEYMSEKQPSAFRSHSENITMVRHFLHNLIKEVVTNREEFLLYGTRWFCPICDQFDKIPSYCEADVKRHIASLHGESIMDFKVVNGYSHSGGDFLCNFCYKEFLGPEELLSHVAFDHQQLQGKIQDLGLPLSDYQPLASSREGKEIRYFQFSTICFQFFNTDTFAIDGDVFAVLAQLDLLQKRN